MQQKRLYVVLPASGRVSWYLKRLAPQFFLGRVAKLSAGSQPAPAALPAAAVSPAALDGRADSVQRETVTKG